VTKLKAVEIAKFSYKLVLLGKYLMSGSL